MSKGFTSFKGRTAVITGAASGIGRALAEQLWTEGCNLALVDVDNAGLNAVSDALRKTRNSGSLTMHITDVADRQSMQALPAAIAAAHGEIQLLFNNAGIGYEAAFPQTSLETWDRVLGVNLWGVIHGCHFFLPYLARTKHAHIVNISSLFGIIGMPGQTAYSASKYAVRGLSESLREELHATTVGLTLVHPSSVATNIMKASDGDDPELLAHLSKWYDKNAMAPEIAAAKIIRAVKKGHPRLLISPESYLADYIKRLMPVAGNKLTCDLIISVLGLEHMRDKRSDQWRREMGLGSE